MFAGENENDCPIVCRLFMSSRRKICEWKIQWKNDSFSMSKKEKKYQLKDKRFPLYCL